MRVVLHVTSGALSGHKTWLRSGQIVEVGRSEDADFVIGDDADLEPRHFAVHCELARCLVRSLAATAPLLVNDQSVSEAELHDGDRISAGSTAFKVEVEGVAATGQTPATGATRATTPPPRPRSAVPDPARQEALSKTPLSTPPRTGPPFGLSAAARAQSGGASPARAASSGSTAAASRGVSASAGMAAAGAAEAACHFGRWVLPSVPAGWVPMGQQGLRSQVPGRFPHSFVSGKAPLPDDVTFEDYVEDLVRQIPEALEGSSADGPVAAEVLGAEAAAVILIHHPPRGKMRLVQRQLLACRSGQVESLTLTTTAEQLAELDSTFQQLVSALILRDDGQ